MCRPNALLINVSDETKNAPRFHWVIREIGDAPLRPQVIKNGCFYAFRRDADDMTVVEKIRIPDYERMKF